MENGGKWALSTIIDKLTNIIGGSMFFLMVSLVGLNVISFWFSGRRYGQLEELVVSCLVWVTFISLGQHYRDKECIRADFLLTAIPPKAQKIVEIITDVASLIIGAVILYFALKLMLRSTIIFHKSSSRIPFQPRRRGCSMSLGTYRLCHLHAKGVFLSGF